MPNTSREIIIQGFRRYGKHLLTLLALGFLLGMAKTWIGEVASKWTAGIQTGVGPYGNLQILMAHLPFELTYQTLAACLMLLMTHKMLKPETSLLRGGIILAGQMGNLVRLAIIHTLIATTVAIPLELLQGLASKMPQWDAVAGALLGALLCWLLAGAYMLLPLTLAVPTLAMEDLKGWTFLRRIYKLAKNHWFLLLKVKLIELALFAIPALGIVASRSFAPLRSAGLGYPLFMLANWIYYALIPLSAALVALLYEHCIAAKQGEARETLQRAA